MDRDDLYFDIYIIQPCDFVTVISLVYSGFTVNTIGIDAAPLGHCSVSIGCRSRRRIRYN